MNKPNKLLKGIYKLTDLLMATGDENWACANIGP